ncbi:hypothetical protein [Brachybacterium kimchii]|uniref:Helix-turn-helix domain-containing protein n=1 Tax=Brachybacterium kimchii TaxID=2942909 RepID=A0ABY4N5P5_9MICO|nr:hypothetical protein [Brachybacterium kimchii]UQN29469.1 hypothetical protein M4486_17820 [Brachybacterium kimchii]
MATRRSIEREDRDLRVYQLAASGLAYAKVAEQMHLSKSTVARIVNKQALEHKDENLKLARDMILQRGQMIVRAHMETIRDPRSADVILKANDQQAKLLGLYTPQQGAGVAEAASLLSTLIQREEAPDA